MIVLYGEHRVKIESIQTLSFYPRYSYPLASFGELSTRQLYCSDDQRLELCSEYDYCIGQDSDLTCIGQNIAGPMLDFRERSVNDFLCALHHCYIAASIPTSVLAYHSNLVTLVQVTL